MVSILYQKGQMIEEYLMEGCLARGIMSEVYLARDTLLDRPVVIKVITPDLRRQPEFEEKFIREAKIQARLDNPHIVQVFRFLKDDRNLILVMQYIQGTDLNMIISEALAHRKKACLTGALTYSRAGHIFFQVLDGMGFMHKHGILHGDMKPANILIDRQGRARISDFGLSSRIFSKRKPETREQSKGGTLAFLSPEEFMDSATDFRADIYALGATFYYMLTGELPAGDIKNTTDLLEFHLEGSLERPGEVLASLEGIPGKVIRAVLKALDPNPENRPQSCLEFMLALKGEAPPELYSEIIRAGFAAKEDISYRERQHLDRLAEQKGLTLQEADRVEQNIRKELGLAPQAFAKEYKEAVEQTGEVERKRIRLIYSQEGRLTADEIGRIDKEYDHS